ncbi:hypothetical protein LguiB_012750 [Lonicera macranthoides]
MESSKSSESLGMKAKRCFHRVERVEVPTAYFVGRNERIWHIGRREENLHLRCLVLRHYRRHLLPLSPSRRSHSPSPLTSPLSPSPSPTPQSAFIFMKTTGIERMMLDCLTQTQTEIVDPENPRCGEDGEGPSGVAPDKNEEGPSSVAPDEDDNDDGGPVDKSVLTSFKDHIAYAIWNRTQDENRKLKTISHWAKLKEWDLSKEVEGVQRRVKATGLTALMEHNYRYIDYVAVQAFVERWHPETNTLHFSFGEMTITLDDVKQILGVPIEGECFNSDEGGKEIEADVARTLASKYLGVSLADVKKETGDTYAVKLQWLKEKCKDRAKIDSTDKELDCCARGVGFVSIFPVVINLFTIWNTLRCNHVCWDPYKDNRVARPFPEVSYYCGLLFCFDIAEAYYPDRFLRQFGRVQSIPTVSMIKATKINQGKTSNAYKVIYDANRWQQNNWSDHLLNESRRSVPAKFSWECEANYMDWYLKITHPYVQVPRLRTTLRRARGAEDVATDKLVSISNHIPFLFLDI